jgi:hypothetical protein
LLALKEDGYSYFGKDKGMRSQTATVSDSAASNLEEGLDQKRDLGRIVSRGTADYYRRLTYLFLYAHELQGRMTTPKAELVKILKDAKVFDPNCGAWLKQKKGFTADPEDRLKLNVGAREQAIKVLDEALDPNVTDQWNPDNRTIKPRGPKKKKKA